MTKPYNINATKMNFGVDAQDREPLALGSNVSEAIQAIKEKYPPEVLPVKRRKTHFFKLSCENDVINLLDNCRNTLAKEFAGECIMDRDIILAVNNGFIQIDIERGLYGYIAKLLKRFHFMSKEEQGKMVNKLILCASVKPFYSHASDSVRIGALFKIYGNTWCYGAMRKAINEYAQQDELGWTECFKKFADKHQLHYTTLATILRNSAKELDIIDVTPAESVEIEILD